MTVIKKIGKFLLYVLIIFIIIVLLIVAALWGYQKYMHHQLSKELEALPVDETQSYEETLHDHLDEKIGENKMTIGEKLELDLDPFEEDTSGDGLSDWEAIHEYDLDPKKFSNADDGISDYVKIQEGLDPKKKVDPKDIEPFTIEADELGTKIESSNLNDKYYTSIEEYDQDDLDLLYKPVREPVRIRDYEGEAFIKVPGGKNKQLSAYYFNFDSDEMEKIKKQKWTDNGMMVTVDEDYPIYIIDEDVLDQIGQYYYFRLSLFQLGREILGYDHQIFLFKRGVFTDELFKNEVIEDPDYGIIEISRAKISYIYSLFLDAAYRTLDLMFKPLDEVDDNILARAILDYGKIEGTPEYVQHYVMPWLYEDEEIETENENSSKVVDSGFRLKTHAFRFGNMRTKIGDGGICAGISRTTELIFNGEGIEPKLEYKPETWRSKIHNKLNDNIYTTLKYDITDKKENYPFLADGELFSYKFIDKQIQHLTEDTFVDGDLTIAPDKLKEPDESLIKLLETQWMYSNEVKHKNKPSYPKDLSILDQVEEYLANGQIIYASLSNGSGGHTVSIYKMEYDRYDPELIRFYVYDPNLPYQRLTGKFDQKEVYMEVYLKRERFFPDSSSKYHYFEFDYTPFDSQKEVYSYSNDNGYTMRLYHNDKPISAN